MNGEAMKESIHPGLAALLVAVSFNVLAEPSEDTCHDRNGLLIRTAECNEWRSHQPSDIECFSDDACRAKAAAASQRRRDKATQEAAASIAEARKQDEAYAKKQKAHAAVMKAACGSDYKAPRIGMTLERIKQCVVDVQLTAQLHREDGVLNTYESPGERFYVMHGKVVAWGFK